MPRTVVVTLFMIGFVVTIMAQYRYMDVRTVSVRVGCQSPGQESIEAYDIATVDVQPAFPGGMGALYHYINTSRRYPAEAYQNGVEGRVLCSFVVNCDGSVSHISVIKGIEPSLDSEAMRIIEEMPRWTAGRLDDKPVPIYCILPIVFRL